MKLLISIMMEIDTGVYGDASEMTVQVKGFLAYDVAA
jgi:hypothetical protein